MRPHLLPSAVLVRWVDFQERCELYAQALLAAESEVARLRRLMSSGTNDVSPVEFAQARDGFAPVHADMQRTRAKAQAQAQLLARTRRWIESLPAGARLTLVPAPSNGASLDAVRGELQGLRAELAKLQAFPPASNDIEAKVRTYVSELARAALPMAAGFQDGGSLTVRWPTSLTASRQDGTGFSLTDANPLLLFAALDANELGELIIRSIVAQQPLSQHEHGERCRQIAARIEALAYDEAALVENTNGEHSVEASPWCVLGVRIAVEEDAAA